MKFTVTVSPIEIARCERAFKNCESTTIAYLTEKEVQVVLDEDLDLFAELLLHGLLALAAQVGRGLADTSEG